MMTRVPRRLLKRARFPRPARAVGCVVLAALLASCSTLPPAREAGPLTGPAPRYALVFLIHGDGDYSYHDPLGVKHRSDQEMLARAQAVAERSPDAEVFIFHQIERKRFLFLFPRSDGRVYHYRNGRLTDKASYRRDREASPFDGEVALYRRLAGTPSGSPVRLFLYSGHELPEVDGAGYDASHRERRVTVEHLAAAVRDITGDTGKVDLLGLATCFGGTPHTIGTLAPYARYIVASPDNLHLSSFDLTPLASLDPDRDDAAVEDLAERFARNAFERLADEVQTVVTVAVYDADETAEYTDSVAGAYRRALAAAAGRSLSSAERCDCADDPAFSLPAMRRGLTVLYRPPQFGRMKNKADHSGWQCLSGWQRQRSVAGALHAEARP